jgi:hypothetical protein
MPDPRRFPPPWSVDEADPEMDRRCFIVRDADRQALAYVFFEGQLDRRSASSLLTRDEARRIAAKIAKLHATRKENWVVPPDHDSPGMHAMREYLDAETRRIRDQSS